MIQPSALNLLIVTCMVIIAGFLLRALAGKFSESPWGQALATIW